MTALAQQHWVPEHSRTHIEALAAATADRTVPASLAELDRLVAANRQIHERDCINLNPATNVMNPRAEAMLSRRARVAGRRSATPATSTRWGWRRSSRSR